MNIEKAKELVTNYMISKNSDVVVQYGALKTIEPYCESLSGMFKVFETLNIEAIHFDSYKSVWVCEIDGYQGEEDYSQLNAAIKSAGEYILDKLQEGSLV